ncbi:hypothetical protein [Lewinella sp. 4G2]|uniref:hypothetical protein n=1 Tax=Lewinella sp. 4G2 TaxID=1803372 RepID=UPI0007B46811|nr:hypothetical protein [Lewinella sp. 4G2]OAV43532.1 hypothetical protein A3850_003045 [Lewinella sp. 4G2]
MTIEDKHVLINFMKTKNMTIFTQALLSFVCVFLVLGCTTTEDTVPLDDFTVKGIKILELPLFDSSGNPWEDDGSQIDLYATFYLRDLIISTDTIQDFKVGEDELTLPETIEVRQSDEKLRFSLFDYDPTRFSPLGFGDFREVYGFTWFPSSGRPAKTSSGALPFRDPFEGIHIELLPLD